MPDEKSFHMTPDEFRQHGHAVVDWIADYYSRIESFPVLSQVKPGGIRASLPASAPAQVISSPIMMPQQSLEGIPENAAMSLDNNPGKGLFALFGASPRAAADHAQARPIRTALAPSASILTTSSPVRIPPSTRISVSPRTASTTPGSANAVEGTESS